MEPGYSIIPARSEHLKALAGIELLAATLLKGHAPAAVLKETTPHKTFREAQAEGRLWIALADEVPIGFALVEMFADEHPHLQEMDVVPQHGRRGVGTALLQTVLEWVHRSGHQEITLTTFRAVPWNMSFYSHHGFVEINPDELSAELKWIVQDETRHGLDPRERVVMKYRVNTL
jgi:GNAT superfamily N-acetyltransferase